MSVRAKFFVQSKSWEEIGTGKGNNPEQGGEVILSPVIRGSQENEQFYNLTPGGQIALRTINRSAYAQFVAGAEYYIDFTPAE